MYQAVMEKIGNPIVFNICMLGALIGLLNIVRTESVLAVIAKRVPDKFVEMNQQALDVGVSMAVPLRS